MALYDYKVSCEIAKDAPFAALILAAFQQADTHNTRRLADAFPDLYIEARDRRNAPGGRLPSDPDGA